MSRKTHRRARALAFGAAAIVAAAGGSAVAGAAAATPGAHASAAHCVVPGSKTLIASKVLRVYQVGRKRFGCLRASNRKRLLDRSFRNAEADKIEVFQRVAVNGTWVVWTQRYRFRGCCTPEGTRLVAEDVRSGRKVRTAFAEHGYGFWLPRALTVSRRGTIAWMNPDAAPSFGTGFGFVVLPSVAGRPAVATAAPDGSASLVRARPDGSFSEPVLLAKPERGRRWGVGAAADFDGDGASDLVLVAKDLVVVLAGRPDGTFAAPRSIPVAYDEEGGAIEVGDADRDGRTDIVVSDSSSVRVLRGLGSFAFSAPIVSSAGDNYPTGGPSISDADGDGIPDMLVHDPVGLSLMHGKGDGTFVAPAALLPSKDIVNGVSVADLNGDRIPDIVYGRDPGGLKLSQIPTVLIGRGGGAFAPPTEYGRSSGVHVTPAIADVTGDGKADIVAATRAESGAAQASTLVGKGDGSFTLPAASEPQLAPRQVNLVDVNGDGKLDVLSDVDDLRLPPGFTVLLGRGDGTFVPAKAGYDIRVKRAGAAPATALRRGVVVDLRTLKFRGETLTWTGDGRRDSARVR
jgi:hypothetical protein